jgi:transposase-like protein
MMYNTRKTDNEQESSMSNGYIAVEDAAKELGVNRSTMYNYKRQLGIEHKKFPLDRHRYITVADFARIKEARRAATERKH